MTEQEMNRLSEKLDEIEARIDNMNHMLNEIMEEINKHKDTSKKTMTYDGEIMFKYKQSNNDK